MDIVIPFTQELREIVESHGWTFYQVPNNPPSWEEIEKRRPAEHLEVGHHCLFAPIPKQGQTLREAYSLTKGLGPSLLVDPSWEGIDEAHKGSSSIEREDEILFTRLWFANPNSAVAISPITRDNDDPSAMSIKMPFVVETFRKYFRIVLPEEYGRKAPIPMPFHVEDN